jgi:hypothetical protein
MADTGRPDDSTDDGPSLEMPSFSLRRKKKAPEAAAPEPAPQADPEPEPTPQPAPEAATAVQQPVRPASTPTATIPVVPAAEPETDDEPAAPKRRAPRQLPTIALSGVPAAAVTGVVVGALAVLLTWLSTTACDVVRGTSSCGGGPGLLILVVVLVLLSWVGGLLLRVFGVDDAGSTSILAVGILAVLVLVFLLGSIDQWWMVIAIPVAAVISYCASWWVTTSVVGDDADTR